MKRETLVNFKEVAKGVFYVVAAIVLVMGCILGLSSMYDYGYRNGQIDAINGIIRYELMEHENGEKTWGKK